MTFMINYDNKLQFDLHKLHSYDFHQYVMVTQR